MGRRPPEVSVASCFLCWKFRAHTVHPMRRLLTSVLVLLLTMLAGSPAQADTLAFSQNSQIGSDFFGMHAITSAAHGLPGVGSVRLWDTDTTWRVLNPRPGKYAWATLDARVAQAQAQGHTVLLVLGATPTWAAESLSDQDASWLGPGSAAAPTDLEDWRAFVKATARRYKGKIEAYQVWNEPTLAAFWRGTDAQLARMTAIAYQEIKAVDPAALIVAPPLVPRQENWKSRSLGLFEAFKQEGWPVDVWTFHGYTPEAGNPDAHLEAIRSVKAFLSEESAPPLPLWETELNFTAPDGGAERVTERVARAWMAKAYLDAARAGVDRVYWYAYARVPAFLRVDIRNPEVAVAFSTMSHWLTSAQLNGCVEDTQGPGRASACLLTDNTGRQSWLLWAPQLRWEELGPGQVVELTGDAWAATGSIPVSTSLVKFIPDDPALTAQIILGPDFQ